jgi:hypothetical protein
MKQPPLITGLFLLATISSAMPIRAAETAATSQPAVEAHDADNAADASAQKRAASIVASLKLDDPAKAARVQTIIENQYVAIHQWHADNDAKRKALGSTQPAGPDADAAKAIQDSYQALHDNYITALSSELTPDQMDKVKEKMTGGQMTATLHNYPVIVPNLTDEELAMISKLLHDAREDAMDSGSRNERIAIFKKYKGRINIYLNAHGHNVSQSYKDFGAAQKAKKASATQADTQPSGN